jgi:hypothetical protein
MISIAKLASQRGNPKQASLNSVKNFLTEYQANSCHISQTIAQDNSIGEKLQLSIPSSVKKLLTESCTNSYTVFRPSQHRF